MKCNVTPFHDHGFLRDLSHTEKRYVCECEYKEPEIYWFDTGNYESIKELGNFLETSVKLEDSYVIFTFKHKQHIIRAGMWLVFNEEKDRFLVCDARWC